MGRGFWHLPEKKLRALPSRLTELQRLGCHGLLVVAEAATERNGGGHDRGDDENALQTLHGLLSFGLTAVAVFACTGAAFSDQERIAVPGPFSRSLMPKCNAESQPPASRG